jgi:hypothetical protein
MGPILRSYSCRAGGKKAVKSGNNAPRFPRSVRNLLGSTSCGRRKSARGVQAECETAETLTVSAGLATTVGGRRKTHVPHCLGCPMEDLPVPKAITQPVHQAAGLCVPYALYNALSEEQRIAWSLGSPASPSAAFRRSARSGNIPLANLKAGSGHTPEEVRRHFSYLKDKEVIKAYDFHRLKRVRQGKAEFSLHTALRSHKISVGLKFLIHGRAPKSDMCKEADKFIKRKVAVDRQAKPSPPSKEHKLNVQICAYNDKTNQVVFGKKIDTCPRHAVSVGYYRLSEIAKSCALPPDLIEWDSARKHAAIMPVLFDPAKNVPKLLTVEAFAASLLSIDEVYHFEMQC